MPTDLNELESSVEALRLYVQFHLKPGELEKFPELKLFLPSASHLDDDEREALLLSLFEKYDTLQPSKDAVNQKLQGVK